MSIYHFLDSTMLFPTTFSRLSGRPWSSLFSVGGITTIFSNFVTLNLAHHCSESNLFAFDAQLTFWPLECCKSCFICMWHVWLMMIIVHRVQLREDFNRLESRLNKDNQRKLSSHIFFEILGLQLLIPLAIQILVMEEDKIFKCDFICIYGNKDFTIIMVSFPRGYFCWI